MKPTNKKQRRKAIVAFSIIFGISVILLALVFYFTLSIPQSEAHQLRSKLADVENQSKFEKDYFAKKVKELNAEFAKLTDDSSEDRDVTYRLIGNLIADVSVEVQKDSTWRKEMYQDILSAYTSWKQNEESLAVTSKAKEDNCADVKEELRQCRAELKSLKTTEKKDSMGL